ncbi:hypothetical protein ABVT39_013816 [Epinephelus coioides]
MDQSTNSSSSPSVSTHPPKRFTAADLLPSNYELLTFLGRGGFGEVVRCLKKDTREIVAVKIPQRGDNIDGELALLTYFQLENLHKQNIVRFIESFTLRNNRTALAFESLDVTLCHYISFQRSYAPLDLHDVRSVVQQLATALKALKDLDVIHADIKLDNIMVVDREAQALSVKLIDFGLAFPTSLAEQGELQQTTHYRAPEIFLGLPFSEAIDMWSVGVVMAYILLAVTLFPGSSEYDTLRCIVELLGVPPHHLLSDGMFSDIYFVEGPSGHWRLRTPQEFWLYITPPGDYRAYTFRNLDDLETLPQENLSMVEVDERKECIDLLKAMLEMDPDERITPRQVLAHPFITRGTLHHPSDAEASLGTPSTSSTYPGVIFVQPAQTAQDLVWGGGNERENKTHSIPEASRGPIVIPTQPPQMSSCSQSSESETCTSGSSGFHESTSSTLPPGVILVKPAPPECRFGFDDDSKHSESCPLDSLEASSENDPVEPPPLLTEGCDEEQEDIEVSATPSDSTEPERKAKKKKKNCWAWTTRTFCCYVSVSDDEA